MSSGAAVSCWGKKGVQSTMHDKFNKRIDEFVKAQSDIQIMKKEVVRRWKE